MLKIYSRLTIKLQQWIKLAIQNLLFCVLVVSCQTKQTSSKISAQLSEQAAIYQKGIALFENARYQEAASFFLKVTQSPEGPHDELYNSALFRLSFVYEKLGEFEKAVLTLIELSARHSKKIPVFKIQLSLAKNYLRLENNVAAFKILKDLDGVKLNQFYSAKDIFSALAENSDFNFDNLVREELRFLGEVQKYFIFVMESNDSSVNEEAAKLLISVYDGFFRTLERDSLNEAFKRSLTIELLEQLRKFDLYKLGDPNQNSITKFSNYAEEKQRYLTDWLHR